ncbi:hypothetical protein [Caulobacter sp. 17J65-9]|uniref:hypothetical protein n=1 Tax=Caulobacter sp. 17J65-9 TaxID=2709382 RepID=UPI0013C99DA3|nr:hypothetical protein [Caulobacter sp. 17J65-9]NEX91279.1 hypothetical protein [Caulobacter sp. 17J65-9]
MTYLDFLRTGSPLHRVTPCESGFCIAPVGEDAAAREAFQALAEVAVEREGQGYRIADVTISEVSGAYEVVFVAPLEAPLQT